MTDRDFEAVSALRRSEAAVPPAARERGRERVERLLHEPSRRRTAARSSARRIFAVAPLAAVLGCALAIGVLLVAGHRHRSPGHAAAASPAELVARFAVFRRAQSTAERAIVHRQRTDRYSGLPRFSNPDSVRILAPGLLAGRRVFAYLVSGPSASRVCVYYPDIDGGGIGCDTAATVDERRTLGVFGTLVYGLAPDGVAQVELSLPTGPVTLPVRNNFWQFRLSSVTPSAVVWKDAQGNEVDPAHAAQPSGRIWVNPPPPKVRRVELHVAIAVLSAHRIRFVPPAARHRYEVSLSCGRPEFDGAVTKPLPGGAPVTVRMNLAAARYRCPRHALLSGQIIDLDRTTASPKPGTALRVLIVGHFRMRR